MGVDCKAYINSAKVEDIITVCAILHAAKKISTAKTKEQYVELDNDAIKVKWGYGDTDKFGYTSLFSAGYLDCLIKSNNGFEHNFKIYPNSNSKGQALIYAKANCKNVALGKKLVEIFGGEFIPSDSNDNILISNQAPLFKPNWTDSESDNYYLEKTLFFRDLNSLTKEDIKDAEKVAAYPLDKDDKILDIYPYKSEFIKEKLDQGLLNKIDSKRKRKI